MHNHTSKQRKSAQRRNAKYAALHATVEKMTTEKKMTAKGTTVSPVSSGRTQSAMPNRSNGPRSARG